MNLTDTSELTAGSGRGLKRSLPAREHEDCGMTPKCVCKYLRSLDAQVDPTILDSGNGGLRNARELGQLTLAQFLKFAQDTHGLADADFHSFLGSTKCFHIKISGSHGA